MKEISIENLSLLNYKEVAKIDNICFPNDSWSVNSYYDEYKQNNRFYLVLKYNNSYIGFCGCSLIFEEVQLNRIAILPEYTNKGYATLLLNNLISNLKLNNNFDYIILEVDENNIKAINLYKKFNFKEISVRKNYYKNGDSALIMKLNLKTK